MSRLEWSEKLKVGHARIDFEHQVFVDLINTLSDKIDQGADVLAISRTLVEIKKYADFHFTSEENIMFDMQYPGIKEHAQMHAHLLGELNQHIMAVAAQNEDPADLLKFLLEWFSNHTSQDDRRIAIYKKNEF